MTELLLVGMVRRPHGLDGEVSVQVLTDFPERFQPGVALLWRRGEETRPLTIRSARPHTGRILLAFEGVDGESGARALAGGELAVEAGEAFRAPAGFFYSHQVRGWRCEDTAGRALGVAVGLEQSPAGPLLAVETEAGKSALVPFVHPIVASVDAEGRRIVLDPPEGLLEL